jgi:uncharacterized protein YebE (UPF0316 family)
MPGLDSHMTILGVSAQLPWGQVPPFAIPLMILVLRTTDLTLATLRMLVVIRGRRGLAWGLGFVQALFFVTAVVAVLSYLQNPWNLVAYALGFATGNVVGIAIEARLAPGHILLRIVSPARADTITEGLRLNGWGATQMAGRGGEGTVGVILCFVQRREIEDARRLILQADPEAFVTVENVRSLHGGWRA